MLIATTGVTGLIQPEHIRARQVILALTNPEPEIEPDTALQCGAAFAADGKSVNNVLGVFGIFKGALQVGARTITDEMLIPASRAIAARSMEINLCLIPWTRKPMKPLHRPS